MDVGIGGSSGASWTFDIKKRVCFTRELNKFPGSHFSYISRF